MTNKITPLEERCNLIKAGAVQDQLEQLIPDKDTRSRFTRAALMAVQNDPTLAGPAVDNKSLFSACLKAATDGLMPDGRDAALITFKNRDTGKATVSYLPMVAGVIKRARNSGQIRTLTAHVVRENDIYSRRMGDHEEIVHDLPREGVDRGKIVAAYAIAQLTDGSYEREWMTVEQIEKRRKCSKSGSDYKTGEPKGIWKQWYDEQCEKTVMHRLCRRLPMSEKALGAIRRLEEDYEFGPTFDVSEEPTPTTALPAQTEEPAPKTETRAAQKLKAAAKKKAAVVEPEVVEVVEEPPPIDDEAIPFADDLI